MPGLEPGTRVKDMMGDGRPYDMFNHNCHHVTAKMPNAPVDTVDVLGIPTCIVPKLEMD